MKTRTEITHPNDREVVAKALLKARRILKTYKPAEINGIINSTLIFALTISKFPSMHWYQCHIDIKQKRLVLITSGGWQIKL